MGSGTDLAKDTASIIVTDDASGDVRGVAFLPWNCIFPDSRDGSVQIRGKIPD